MVGLGLTECQIVGLWDQEDGYPAEEEENTEEDKDSVVDHCSCQ